MLRALEVSWLYVTLIVIIFFIIIITIIDPPRIGSGPPRWTPPKQVATADTTLSRTPRLISSQSSKCCRIPYTWISAIPSGQIAQDLILAKWCHQVSPENYTNPNPMWYYYTGNILTLYKSWYFVHSQFGIIHSWIIVQDSFIWFTCMDRHYACGSIYTGGQNIAFRR